MLATYTRAFVRLAMEGSNDLGGIARAQRAAKRALQSLPRADGGSGSDNPQARHKDSGPRNGRRRPRTWQPKSRRGLSELALDPVAKKEPVEAALPPSPALRKTRTTTTTLSQVTEDHFDSLEIHGGTKTAIAKVFGYEKMTKVQSATIPLGLTGVDLLAKAKTGTGKTIAFLVPAIERIVGMEVAQKRSISVVVISPTRELAQQIADEGKSLIKFHRTVTLDCVVGGTNIRGDLKRFQQQVPDILVGTPGRLLDHLENQGLRRNLREMKILILDECDRLLDMGFRQEISKICRQMPSERQTILFSATLPDDVQSMCESTLKPSYKLMDCVGKEESTHQHVKQTCIVSRMEDQVPDLLAVLKEGIKTPGYKIIVFFVTARLTQFYAELFNNMNMGVLEIHSRKAQGHRNRVSEQFRNGESLIMFTSDVSARGMDYPDVSLVVQVGMPADKAQYIHRLGRTARAGKDGQGILLLSNFEQNFLNEIQDLPIEKASPPSHRDFSEVISLGISKLPDRTITCAYQAWLGFYNSHLRKIRWDKDQLVAMGNEFSAQVCEQSEPPALNASTISKMGLKGVPGLNILRGNAAGKRGGSRVGPGDGIGYGGDRDRSSGGGRRSFETGWASSRGTSDGYGNDYGRKRRYGRGSDQGGSSQRSRGSDYGGYGQQAHGRNRW